MSYNYGQGYGAPPPVQYGTHPQPNYGAPQYAPPGGPPPGQYQQPGYGAPQQQYAPPSGPPPGQYGAPQYGGHQQYAPPAGPPPGQYAPPAGPPPGQYGQPAYGAPPQQYGAPQQYAPPAGPPPGQYAPPAGPPPGQYAPPAGPPPGQYGGYQQPAYGAPTPASLGYGPPQIINWDARGAAGDARKAMKGFGTNEKLLINSLADKDPLQIEAIKASFRQQFGRDLLKDVQSETSGNLEFGLMALVRGPCLNDAYEVHRAVQGPGTNERALNDVLLGRSNADINAIKSMYHTVFRRDMVADVKGDLSMKTKRMFEIILSAQKAEDSVVPNQQQIDTDVRELYSATEGRAGTDEIKVCSIMALRNDAQIRAIADAYRRAYSRDLESVFKSEFSGHMEDALVYQLRNALNPHDNAAQEIERAMRGVGTDEKALARRIISIHWNRQFTEGVKNAYHARYKTPLVSRVRGELSGDFEKLIVACLGHPC